MSKFRTESQKRKRAIIGESTVIIIIALIAVILGLIFGLKNDTPTPAQVKVPKTTIITKPVEPEPMETTTPEPVKNEEASKVPNRPPLDIDRETQRAIETVMRLEITGRAPGIYMRDPITLEIIYLESIDAIKKGNPE